MTKLSCGHDWRGGRTYSSVRGLLVCSVACAAVPQPGMNVVLGGAAGGGKTQMLGDLHNAMTKAVTATARREPVAPWRLFGSPGCASCSMFLGCDACYLDSEALTFRCEEGHRQSREWNAMNDANHEPHARIGTDPQSIGPGAGIGIWASRGMR